MDINLGTLLKLRTQAWALARGYVKKDEAKTDQDLFRDVLAPFIAVASRHMPEEAIFALGEDLSKVMKKNVLPDVKTIHAEARHGSRGFMYEPWTVIVPTRRTNRHDYDLEKPVLIIEGARGYRKTRNGMMMGNHLPDTKNEVRPATDAEIDAFLEDIKGEFMGKIMDIHQETVKPSLATRLIAVAAPAQKKKRKHR